MGFEFDPEIATALADMAQAAQVPPPPSDADVLTLRAGIDRMLEATFAALPDAPDVSATDHPVRTADGAVIPVRRYVRAGGSARSSVVYVHGGGMICGSVDLYDRLVRFYVQASGVPFLSVDYRLAPESRDVGLAQDVLAALVWLNGAAGSLALDADRIAVMGDSGGGGVAAAAAILARDAGIRLARQILIYPMLDDRNVVPVAQLEPFALWSYAYNRTAWAAVLGSRAEAAIPPTLAPARLTAFDGLAPAYVEVGELDIFRDESIAYARGLLAAGVPCEFHVHGGAPHSHDWLAPGSALSERVLADRIRILRSL